MTTSISSNAFDTSTDMKGLHVIEFITNDQPYSTEKDIFQTDDGLPCDDAHFFDDGIIETAAAVVAEDLDADAGDDAEIKKAAEEQEKQLRYKEEELQELYETFAELEEELHE
ncbi:8638_t:CDS:2, partial [Racocetra fulgida]